MLRQTRGEEYSSDKRKIVRSPLDSVWITCQERPNNIAEQYEPIPEDREESSLNKITVSISISQRLARYTFTKQFT